MRFIHSNKQYIERTMYPINPYMNAPAVAPLTMEAFVAPADFNPDAQELNIVNAFAAYPDANKKYIFSVDSSVTTTELPSKYGSYAYSENEGPYTAIANGTITWTTGSTKRNVIFIGIYNEIEANVPSGAVWLYVSSKCNSASSLHNVYLKYVHFQNLNTYTILLGGSFGGCSNLSGIAKIPPFVNTIGYAFFSGCIKITDIIMNDLVTVIPYSFIGINNFNGSLSGNLILREGITEIGGNAFCRAGYSTLTIPSTVTNIGATAFILCANLSKIYCYRSIPPTISDSTFLAIASNPILHVPVGSLAAYQAAPYWNEFTNIIDDL